MRVGQGYILRQDIFFAILDLYISNIFLILKSFSFWGCIPLPPRCAPTSFSHENTCCRYSNKVTKTSKIGYWVFLH